MTTFVDGNGNFAFEETCKCDEDSEEHNHIDEYKVNNAEQENMTNDFISNEPWLIDLNATSLDEYLNKHDCVIFEKYLGKPTLTVLAPFRTNADLLVKKEVKVERFSIADKYTTEHDKIFEVEQGDIITILGRLDTYPAIKLFKNMFYYFDGELQAIPKDGFTSTFKAKLIIPKGIDIIDDSKEGIMKSLKHEMNNNSTLYEIKDVKFEKGFGDGSKEITITFGLTESYTNKTLKNIENDINKALSGNVNQSLDNYLYMIDNLIVNDTAVDYNSIELKVEVNTEFAIPCDQGCSYGTNHKSTYYGAQTDEGRDAHYPNEKNKIFLTVGTDAKPEPINPGKSNDSEEPTVPSEPVDPDPVPELNKKDHFGYMVGYKDGTFKPNDNITRAEAITIFFRMLTENARNQYWSTVNNFKDVNETAWYNNAVSTMANAKVISADANGNFRPNEAMTRGEFAVLLSKFFNETGTKTHNFADIKGHFAEDEIAKVAAKGWIEGYADKTFRPDEKITRAETVKLVNRILERTPDIKNLLANMIEFKDNQDVDKWYYVEIQEAANSHEYTRKDNKSAETWTKLLPVRDWVALEKEWSKANSSTNPGNVK